MSNNNKIKMAIETSNEHENSMKENKGFILLICCVATIGGFLFGFDSGVINGTVDGLQLAFNSDSVGTGFNVASMLLGCAFGAFIAGSLADKLGRKTILIFTAVLFIISAWGSGISVTSFEFILYRVVGGLAVGAASILAPAYISEISPAKYRGTLSSIQQIAIISGLFSAFVSNYFLADFAGESTAILWLDYEAWRWMFWIELIPAFVFLFALFFIPESPRFLVLKERNDKAKNILTRLYGQNYATSKFAEISESFSKANHQPQFSDLLNENTKKVRTIVWVGIGLATFQQLVGINVVFYYGAVLWQAVGFSESNALLINILSGGVSIVACVLAMYYIDKIGRKPLLVFGSIGMTIALTTLVVSFATSDIGPSGNLNMGSMGIVALIAANAYVFFFNISWGPVMWVLLGEMFPNQLRGLGLAVSGFAQWSANFVITMMFPIMLGSIGLASAYGFYAICAGLSVVFVLKFVSETKGKELEQMDSR